MKPRKLETIQPTAPKIVTLINQSTKLRDDSVRKAVRAFNKQLSRDVAPVWGAVPTVVTGTAGNVKAWLVDALPEAPGALGYHDRDEKGCSYIKVLVTPEGDWRTTMSHELLEMVGDAPANRWCDGPDGCDYALELCDAVQDTTYKIDGVPVSNFVYPAFFNPDASSADRLDFMKVHPGAFGMTSGGYQIKRTEPGKVSQVQAYHARYGETADQAPLFWGSRVVVVAFGESFPAHRKQALVCKVARKYNHK